VSIVRVSNKGLNILMLYNFLFLSIVSLPLRIESIVLVKTISDFV
jgi:hypothetical protein